ncbi:dephospho-CoA kinase [Rhodovulum sp. DZ06]|uniref:dephospho-CoA kinase n=1 Tax=Rhodovulum sp. DZ06 TaxID=3425126 RepID=UPI003D327167
MFKLALTGSIGMGKSTTAAMFAEEGVPVWDADAAVARLYGPGGAAVPAVAEIAPNAVRPVDGTLAVDRAALRAAVTEDPSLVKLLEKVVHPLVGEDRADFLAQAEANGAPIALCDIPILYETGGDKAFDGVAVVSAPADVQRERVLARPGMTAETLDMILSRQTPDAEKRGRADWVIDTGQGLEAARDQVRAVLDEIRERTA